MTQKLKAFFLVVFLPSAIIGAWVLWNNPLDGGTVLENGKDYEVVQVLEENDGMETVAIVRIKDIALGRGVKITMRGRHLSCVPRYFRPEWQGRYGIMYHPLDAQGNPLEDWRDAECAPTKG